ncbi:SH3 domain-containing protein [Streptomyces hawaiiensis]|uniref:SH3 domain-containing protein n=1 Tax=Streptomyces hawaiiensis TaxID=67305 RepID=UPI001FE4B358|nr:SH3 domain-containing protein [Streptomyces hawaiiensis]
MRLLGIPDICQDRSLLRSPSLSCTSFPVIPVARSTLRLRIRTAKAASKDSGYLATLTAGKTYQAYCRTHGQTITDNGYTNDIWIGFGDGYSSAVYFKGDRYGNLPSSDQC